MAKSKRRSGSNRAAKFGTNIANTLTNKQNRKDIAFIFLGATLYATVPTFIAKMFKVDLSGIKGAMVGLASGLVAAGFGGSGAAVFGGSVGAFFAHLWWSQLNGAVAYPVFGTYLWRWDPSAKNLGMQTAPPSLGEDLGSGMQMITLPNGSRVPVYTSAPSNVLPESRQDGLNDFVQNLNDYAENLGDYAQNMGDNAQNMGDFTQNMGDYAQSIGDQIAAQSDPDYADYADMM